MLLCPSGLSASELIVCPEHAISQGECEFLGGAGLQAAVAAAKDNDRIHLREGTYRFDVPLDRKFRPEPEGETFVMRAGLVIEHKAITLTGKPGTVIDNRDGPSMSAIYLNNADVTIEGLAITNFAYASGEDEIYDGHAIFALDTRVRLRNLRIENADKMAITGRGESQLDIDRLWIPQGHVGIWLRETSTARLTNSVLENLDPAAVAVYADSVIHIRNARFTRSLDDALFASDNAAVFVENSILEDNSPFALHAEREARIYARHIADIGNAALSGQDGEARITVADAVTASTADFDRFNRLQAGSVLLGRGAPHSEVAGRRPTHIGPLDSWVSAFAQTPPADCDDCPALSYIPGGMASVGHSIDRSYGAGLHGPTHNVRIHPFAAARHEVTVGEYRRFVEATGRTGSSPCYFYDTDTPWHIEPGLDWDNLPFEQGEDHPVLCVSWEDARDYARWLTAQSGKPYRLMSEVEWEYLAVTGGREAGDDGAGVTHADANIGAGECCSGAVAGNDIWMATAPVGSFEPDAWGIYDLHGNAYEWQADCFADDYVGAPEDSSARTDCTQIGQRVTRGGSFNDSGEYFAPSFRVNGRQDAGYFTLGFRVARDVSDAELELLGFPRIGN